MSDNLYKKFVLPLLLILFILFFINPVSAGDDLEIWGYVNPEGNLAPGDEVYCYYTVQYDFESDAESLEFYTDLTDPIWRFTISIDGSEQEKAKDTGRYETISGFELYYPRSYQTLVRVKLNGTVPSVGTTGNYSIFEVSHYDAMGEIESSAKVERVFLNPSDLSGIQKTMELKLSDLRSEINNLYSLGVNTNSAEAKYTDAYNAVSRANDSTPSVQSSLLTSAETYIEEAGSILDVSWTEYLLEEAGKKIDSVDSMISYFEDSERLSSDSRVWVIKSYNDNAKTLLVLAEDKFNLLDYPKARDYASQAQTKAEEAHSYAAALNDELSLDAPEQTNLWNTVTPAATSTTRTELKTTTVNPTETKIGSDELDDVDSLLHSEVSIDSFLQIAGKAYDLFISGYEFLNDLLASASDN